MYSTSFPQPSGETLHVANTRLHSASAESNCSSATDRNGRSFETLGSNKYKILSEELVPWKHTHQMYIAVLPQKEFLSPSRLSFSPIY